MRGCVPIRPRSGQSIWRSSRWTTVLKSSNHPKPETWLNLLCLVPTPRTKAEMFVSVSSAFLMNEFTVDPRLQDLNVFKLFGRNGEHITINGNKIRQFGRPPMIL